MLRYYKITMIMNIFTGSFKKNQNAMNFLELVKERRSVRRYHPRGVEQQKLDYVLECARLAPSACNKQPWTFLIVSGEESRRKLFQCYPSAWFSTDPAPLFIIACADTGESWKRSYDGKDHAEVDLAIAFEHICLAAAEQGLGTCWICHFDPAKLTDLFGLPANMVPVAVTPLGYPADENPERKPRKEIGAITQTL